MVAPARRQRLEPGARREGCVARPRAPRRGAGDPARGRALRLDGALRPPAGRSRVRHPREPARRAHEGHARRPRVSLLVMQAEGEGVAAQALARVSVQGEAREAREGVGRRARLPRGLPRALSRGRAAHGIRRLLLLRDPPRAGALRGRLRAGHEPHGRDARGRPQRPHDLWMIALATKPSMPKASTKNRMKVPNFPAFDSLARLPMMNSMKRMNPPTPKVTPNSAICASV